MPVSPVTILEHLAAELRTLFPASGADGAYAIRESFGAQDGPEVDANLLRQRYGVMIGGRNVLRGWWVEWASMQSTRTYVAGSATHVHMWTLNGIYQILSGDSDTMMKQALADVSTLYTHWENNPTFTADGASITTIVPGGEAGVQYESNTQTGILLAGSSVYMPVCSIQTFYSQVVN